MTENLISNKIIGAAIEIHKTIGPGLLESVYELALEYELIKMGLEVKTQIPIPVIYKDIRLDKGFKIDILVENKVIIELKSVESLAPIHFAQTLTYLKLTEIKLGLLINFNSVLVKEGIHRIVNKL
jgi:GxxExxY protein